jgi:monoamine oxidase
VIVAGAGLAGLTAARALARRGASVRVIEARERLGGRVWTYRAAPIAPFHVELGGELIDAEHTALLRLCRELGLQIARILRGGFGLALALGGGVHVSARQTAIFRRYALAFRPYVRALESADRDPASSAAAALARLSVADVLARARADAPVREMARALRNLYLAEPEELSAIAAAEMVTEGGNPSEMKMYRIRGGADRLVQALAAGLCDAIELRHIVRAVAQDGRRVRVTIEGPTGRRATASADYAVLALPMTALRRIELTPPLPDAQRQAFEALAFGPATKAILRFARPWWRRPGRPLAFGTNLPIGAVWDAAEEQRGAALLMLLAGGRASGHLKQLLAGSAPERELRRHLRWLGTMPEESPQIFAVSWDDDPWAQGGYEYPTPAFDPALQPLLSRSVGRVFFAGSHTSARFQGYMNGAVESGQRAARELESLAPVLDR